MLKLTERLRRGHTTWAGAGVLALLAFMGGFLLRGRTGESGTPLSQTLAHETPANNIEIWTCSMHPQIQLPKPGQCPLCGMDLIPLEPNSENEGGLRVLSVSSNSAKLMEIETSPVERRFVTATVRMVGKIDYDETRVSYITAWVPGRLDRLFVDYTGVPVKKGDHLVYLYSPELLSAQEELLQAIHATQALERSDAPMVRETTQAMVDAAREKLRLWGVTPDQIKTLEQRGKPDDHITIYAPEGGIVVHKNAQEGMYVNTGTRIYTVADLSRVWVNLDAYESDLAWLRYGQHVTFTAEAYPGEVFTGSISFIQPVLDETTRTIKVRVNVPNPQGRLKPGLFVRAIVEASVATGGRIRDTDLAGKWISPMHPEIVKDGPGFCDVCGMPLVRAESLGYVGAVPTAEDEPLVVPASAPLLTGKRAIVYVEVPNQDKPTFEGREIVLGPRAGDFYLVKHGLAAGERVVTRGNFKLDAELQIRAKPSMMTPGGGMPDWHGGPSMEAGAAPMSVPGMTLPEDVARQFQAVISHYLDIQGALAKDALTEARDAARKDIEALSAVDLAQIRGPAQVAWVKHQSELKPLLSRLAEALDIEGARKEFALVSEEFAALITRFRPLSKPAYQFKCPMAFDGRGAIWLQGDQEIRNPYFGAAMLKCGDMTDIIPAFGVEREHRHD